MARPASAEAAAVAARARALRTPHLAAEVLSPRDRAAPPYDRLRGERHGCLRGALRDRAVAPFAVRPRTRARWTQNTKYQNCYFAYVLPPFPVPLKARSAECFACCALRLSQLPRPNAVHQMLYVHVEQLTAHGGCARAPRGSHASPTSQPRLLAEWMSSTASTCFQDGSATSTKTRRQEEVHPVSHSSWYGSPQRQTPLWVKEKQSSSADRSRAGWPTGAWRTQRASRASPWVPLGTPRASARPFLRRIRSKSRSIGLRTA